VEGEGDLGELRSTHVQGRSLRAAFLVATSAAALTAGLSYAGRQAAPFLAGVAVLVALLPMWFFSELLVGLGSVVELWDGGLVLRRRWTEPAAVRFDDVDAVYLDFEQRGLWGVRLAPTAKVILTTHEGRRVVVPRGLTGAGHVLAAIDRKVERALVAPAQQALSAGEPLTFGRLVLERDGLEVGGEHLRWDEVERVEAARDALTIHAKGDRRGASLPVRELPHPRVLVLLLASRVEVAGWSALLEDDERSRAWSSRT
jgi:hypothetical protein